MKLVVSRVKCGTTSGYTRGCRCDECREAMSVYQREYYQRRKMGVSTHGTMDGLKMNCSCAKCSIYRSGYYAGYRHRRNGSGPVVSDEE